eukprot:TRINITY_DN9231_c0_g1_i1.p1 TRINITY_DN9231_c0_g1~~TRINITY_DN9231_c0_g1_i1.p1  ORF type:complete len:192 (+),score=52.85 TRINITY_DN9231_c0_g1_i1:61-636(+)
MKDRLEKYITKRKIEQSARINNSRLQKMNARFDVLQEIKQEARTTLIQRLKQSEFYKGVLKSLIIQGLIKLMEPEVTIKCRKEDVELVKEVVPETERQFNDLVKANTKIKLETRLIVNTTDFLKPQDAGVGGVVLTGLQGKIVCANTLDLRLDLCYQEFLPELRAGLFPDLAAADYKPRAPAPPTHGHGHH